MMSLLMFLSFFIHNITSIYHFFYDCLICSCCTFSHLFYFPNLVKTDLFYILLQNYMRRDEFVLIGHIKQSVPQFTSGSCNCGNHSVIVFSFTTTQSKIKKNTLSRGSPYILFQPSIYISINCPDILGKFYTGFALPCNP